MPGYYGGIYFLIFLCLVLLTIRWAISEETQKGKPSEGLFAIRDGSIKKVKAPLRRPGGLHMELPRS
jgi:hypothetical protein